VTGALLSIHAAIAGHHLAERGSGHRAVAAATGTDIRTGGGSLERERSPGPSPLAAGGGAGAGGEGAGNTVEAVAGSMDGRLSIEAAGKGSRERGRTIDAGRAPPHGATIVEAPAMGERGGASSLQKEADSDSLPTPATRRPTTLGVLSGK